MASDPVPAEPDPGLHRPRIVTLAALVGILLTGLAMPAIGLHRESGPTWVLLTGRSVTAGGRPGPGSAPRTVRNHLAAVVGKLGVATRAEAHRTAHDNGWL